MKSWDDLSIKDDFMFAKVMRNKELCKTILEKILEIKIDHIEYPEEQKTIDIAVDARSVRLDVYVQDGNNTVYNIEMQTTDTKNLPKRSRYYQGMIDLNLIEKGELFHKLNKSYIIFICTFDIFNKGRYIYTFENCCLEDTSILLNDETTKIFLNTKGTQEDIDEDVKAFLRYVDGELVHNDFVEQIQSEIAKIKKNEEWRREYMTLFMRDQENIEKGLQQGLQQGLEQGLEQGLQQGEELGIQLKKEEIVSNMIGLGFNTEIIVKTTGATLQEIEEIRNKKESNDNI